MQSGKVHIKKIKTLADLFFRSGRAVRIVNLITVYRIITAPLLLILLFTGYMIAFKWLLLASFLTDAVDGQLARKYNAVSILGSKLDSIGDDLTILVAIIGIFKMKIEFVKDELLLIACMLILFFIQTGVALYKYRKTTSFHTYFAKLAAIAQACFLLHAFFFDVINYPLFYIAAGITIIELVEETVMVLVLPKWQNDVKGLYWALRRKRDPELP